MTNDLQHFANSLARPLSPRDARPNVGRAPKRPLGATVISLNRASMSRRTRHLVQTGEVLLAVGECYFRRPKWIACPATISTSAPRRSRASHRLSAADSGVSQARTCCDVVQ